MYIDNFFLKVAKNLKSLVLLYYLYKQSKVAITWKGRLTFWLFQKARTACLENLDYLGPSAWIKI